MASLLFKFKFAQSGRVINRSRRGFTVLELLLSLTVLVISFFIFISFFNPDQFLKQMRDQQRIKDLEAIREALTRYSELGTGISSLGTVGVVYGSNEGMITATDGQQIAVRYSTQNPALTNSLGWLPANLDLVQSKKFSDLPRDPRNVDHHIYTFTTDGKGGYKLTTAFESDKYHSLMDKDCGSNPNRYELGTNCSLQP
jgi:hypothetical protein